jgi:hypothetical protein
MPLPAVAKEDRIQRKVVDASISPISETVGVQILHSRLSLQGREAGVFVVSSWEFLERSSSKIGRVKGKDSEDRMPNCCSYGNQHDILVSKSHSGEYRARSRDSMLEWASGFVVEEQAVGDDSHLMDETVRCLSCLRTAPMVWGQCYIC